MKISINCKLDTLGCWRFIKPIVNINEIDEIKVFRDEKSVTNTKIKYYIPKINHPKLLKNIYKFIQMLFLVDKNTELSIGIYEIPHGLLAFLIGKIKKIPIIISIISNPGYAEIRKGVRKFIMYWILKRANCVTVTGNTSKQILIRNGVSPEKIYKLPNQIDSAFFSSQKFNDRKKYDIIILCRLSKEKKLDNFLTIVDLLRKKIPNIKVAIGGSGPEKERLHKIIQELSLDSNVKLLGYIDDENIVEFYNNSKIFLLTSSTEGLPRTVIEAMACGIPCIVSKVGDIEDIVKNEENGFVISDYSNINEFAQKALLLLSDEEIYQNFSRNTISFAKENYSQQASTDVWKAMINNIFGENYVK